MWKIINGTTPSPRRTTSEETQDHYGHTTIGDTCLIVAADGAGSQPNSKEGAQYAVEQALKLFETTYHDGGATTENITALLQNIYDNFHYNYNANVKQYATTIALAIVTPKRWVAAAVGDSFIVVDDTLEYFYTSDDSGEYVNETVFLSAPTLNPAIKHGNSPRFVAAATDGLKNVSVENGTPYLGFWEGIRKMNDSEQLEQLFEQMREQYRLTDDTTIVCAKAGRPA